METKPRLLTILDWLSIILFLFATGMVFIYAPMEAVLGNVQRVFYFHVAAGWVGMISLGVAVFAAIAYLRTSDRKWDIIGLASIEIGLVFSFHQHHQRCHLGTPHLEHLVDLGPTFGYSHHHGVDLSGLSDVTPGY